MARNLVCDASVVASFLLREPNGKKFDPILQGMADGEQIGHVPALFVWEMSNIMLMAERQKRISSMQLEQAFTEWEQLPLQVDGVPSLGMRRRTLDLARTHGLTAYDAAYLELALRLQAPLFSLDRDILRLKKTFDWIS
jgi:predicted nucleic acid-binding protein